MLGSVPGAVPLSGGAGTLSSQLTGARTTWVADGGRLTAESAVWPPPRTPLAALYTAHRCRLRH